MVRTLIVDDEPDMRLLVRLTIEAANHGLEIAGEANDGEQGIAAWREFNPDVIIMDNRMPVLQGMEAAREILAESPDQAIILFSAFLTDDLVSEAHRMGVRACLPKNEMQSLPETLWAMAG